MRFSLESSEQQVAGLAGRLQALSPLAVLARGYSITLKLPERRVLTSSSRLRPGDRLETMLAQGRVESTVSRVTGAAAGADSPATRGSRNGDQADLFGREDE
jgi:exodeoxyribonuclease VII large subunit